MRLQVNVSEEMVKEVDRYAALMGVSRSALCSMFIGQGIMSYNKGFAMLENLGAMLGDELLKAKAEDELSKLLK